MTDWTRLMATRVRALRESAGLTQQQLASMTGITRPNVSRLESGRSHSPTLATLERVALALGTSVRELVDVDTDETGSVEVVRRLHRELRDLRYQLAAETAERRAAERRVERAAEIASTLAERVGAL